MAKARMNVSDDAAWDAAANGTPAAGLAAERPADQASKPASTGAGKPASKDPRLQASKPAQAEADQSPRGKQVPAGLAAFSTYLPPDLRKRLKVHAAEVGRPVWQIVADALEAMLPRR